MKILLVYSHIPHHSSHSGYDMLARHIPFSSQYQPGKIFRWLSSKNPDKFRRFKAIHSNWYHFNHFSMEMELSFRINLVNKTIVHFLYGENNFRYMARFPLLRGNRTVVSFHQPPEKFLEVIPDHKGIFRADAIVAVGSSQMAFFRDLSKRDNIFLVPHGIDTDYFTPPERREDDGVLRCISVGWWLRDVDKIRAAIKILNQIRNSRVEFHIVTFPWCHEFYAGLENVHLHSEIPDDELRDLYRKCHVLFLPLKDCTANNAVLEAMACGLPVLTTDVGSIRDYVGEDNAVIAPPDNEEPLLDALLDFQKDPARLKAMGEVSRQRAEKFAWPVVGRQMMDVYRKIG